MKIAYVVAAGALLVAGGLALALSTGGEGPEASVEAPTVPVADLLPEEESLRQARTDARATFGEFWSRVTADRSGIDAIGIKVSIPHAEGVEHLWMTGCRTGDLDSFECVVSNEPKAVPLELGSRFTFDTDAISDWMYRKDGKIHGGYSIRALLPTLPEDEAESMREMLAPLPG